MNVAGVLKRPKIEYCAEAVLLLLATWQTARLYVNLTFSYLNMERYLNGTERMPFQGRVLPVFFIQFIDSCGPLARFLSARKGPIAHHGMGAVFLLCLFSLVATGVFARALYRRYSPVGALVGAVYPAVLLAFLLSYVLHGEQNYAYPYDALGLAFFTAGLFFISADWFLPLVAIMLVGSFNRETTLFLVVLYGIHQTQNLRRAGQPVIWLRMAVLSLIWLAIHLFLAHRYAANDHREQYVRLWENLRALKASNLASISDICGYALPLVVLLRRRLPPQFANFLWVLPVWGAVMLYTGLILETRIWGELCSYTAVAVVLLLESIVQQHALPNTSDASVATVPRYVSSTSVT